MYLCANIACNGVMAHLIYIMHAQNARFTNPGLYMHAYLLICQNYFISIKIWFSRIKYCNYIMICLLFHFEFTGRKVDDKVTSGQHQNNSQRHMYSDTSQRQHARLYTRLYFTLVVMSNYLYFHKNMILKNKVKFDLFYISFWI